MTEPLASVWMLEDSRLEATLAQRVIGDEFDVEWFTDGAVLLEELGQRRPDVLILDARLPGLSGIEVCRFVRGTYDELTLPALFLTAYESEADVVDVLSSGANDYVRKPYDAAELKARVRTLVRLVRAHRERVQLLASEREARLLAEQSNRAKDEFLSVVSHELRTPLNAVLGWARLLSNGMARGDLRPEATVRGLKTIERNALAQAQLIEDLLDVSRIATGKLSLVVESVALVEIVEGAIESVRPALEAKGLSIEQDLQPGDAAISGDPNRLRQVVWNLLSNAIKFTPKGGRVTAILRRLDGHVELSVRDTGQGIRPEFLPRMFGRFEQQDASSTRERGGLGLGLSICRDIVALHGGTIRAHSEGEGKGSTFTVEFPVSGPTARARAASPRRALPVDMPRESPPEIAGLKVLVVDDEADAREFVAFVLERSGAKAMAVGSAREAMDALERERWDVLLSDLGMPEEDGYSLIRRIRARPDTAGGLIPAAVLTAYVGAEDRRRALDAGYQMHVAKPVEPEEILTVVAALARIGNAMG